MSALRQATVQLLNENAQEIRASVQDLRALFASVFVAQEMGTRLGSGEILLGTLPPRLQAGCDGMPQERGLSVRVSLVDQAAIFLFLEFSIDHHAVGALGSLFAGKLVDRRDHAIEHGAS